MCSLANNMINVIENLPFQTVYHHEDQYRLAELPPCFFPKKNSQGRQTIWSHMLIMYPFMKSLIQNWGYSINDCSFTCPICSHKGYSISNRMNKSFKFDNLTYNMLFLAFTPNKSEEASIPICLIFSSVFFLKPTMNKFPFLF